jgi:predicted acylesterase/phospholipase RssA
MGPDAAALLGVYEALVEGGRPPDVVIGTSGGALVAALIGGIPDRHERYEALQSPEQQAFFIAARIAQPSVLRMGGLILSWLLHSAMRVTYRPDSGGDSVCELPACQPLPGLQRSFNGLGSPRIAMLGGRIYADQREPRYVETWFTYSETAVLLRDARAAVGVAFPRSLIHDAVEVVTDAKLVDAARASIAEPHFFRPYALAGAAYAGGLVNLWPCEPAAELADEVIAVATPPCDFIQAAHVSATFGYDVRRRMRMVRALPGMRWIDFGDANRVLRPVTFWFGLSCLHDGRLVPPRIVSRVPRDLQRFRASIAAQYRYGYDRGLAAEWSRPVPSGGPLRSPDTPL